MDKWDTRFLALARHIAEWSKDTSSKVGCVLVGQGNRIISLGFNGPPSNTVDGDYVRDRKLKRTIHAEANALHFANVDVTGCTAYVTHPPCSSCTGHLIQRGVGRIVHFSGTEDFVTRWQDDIKESEMMCAESDTVLVAMKGGQ